MKTLFVIIWKESEEILTPDSFKKYWPNYGSNNLHGWRPAKKIYYKMGQAKNGFSYIPDEIKPELAIAEFSLDKIVLGGVELNETQQKAKAKRIAKQEKNRADWELKLAEEKLKEAQDTINKLKK